MAQIIFSRSLVSAFSRFLAETSYNNYTYVGADNTDIRFNNHNFNPVFLRTCVDNNVKVTKVHRVPVPINDYRTKQCIRNEVTYNFVAPLSIIENNLCRTADSAVKYFLSSPRRSWENYRGLKKAVVGKGEIYYGTPGLILDHNFEPIIIGLFEYVNKQNLRLKNCILRVNPKVFLSEGLIEKFIIKKMIPFFVRYNKYNEADVNIEIGDINQYIVKPNSPKEKVQESMQDIMCTYKDEILLDII